jgi:Pyruvate/2-oxoacid:ferredoxin oxidoreductase gamma subunit
VYTAVKFYQISRVRLPLSMDTLKQVVRENVRPKTIEANLRAFELGFNAVQKKSL